jgi:hypothetical protein
MTEDDEETREHPVYPDAPPPMEPAHPDSPRVDAPAEGASAAGAQPAAPMTVDPLEPTTTIDVAAPAAPAYPQPPAYSQPPNQSWPGQPPAAANLPGQWQGPGYGQPDYGGQPGYPQAQPHGAAAATYGTSIFVALGAMLMVIMGVALAVLGAWLLTQGPALGDLVQRLRSVDLVVFKPTREVLRSMVSASPGALMVLGVLQLLIGAFVLGHRGWARWLGVILALIGLIFSIVALTSTLALIPGTSVQLIVAIAFLVSYAFVLLALIAGGGHFRKHYERR